MMIEKTLSLAIWNKTFWAGLNPGLFQCSHGLKISEAQKLISLPDEIWSEKLKLPQEK